MPLIVTRRRSLILAAAAALFAFPSLALAQTGAELSQKQQVVELLKSIATGTADPAGVINKDSYTQHNLAFPDGFAGFSGAVSSLPPGSVKVDTVRVFQDGNYVFAHTNYDIFGPKIGFDIFRFDGNQIVEHWDNLQETAGPNPSGNSMIDGATEVSDLDKTDANKKLVGAFVNDLLTNNLAALPAYFDGDNYIQHNPQIANGLTGLSSALGAMAAQGIVMKYDVIHHVFGEGNFVLVVSEGSLGGRPISFYDLFRVANGKIAEHWDTLETIPAKADWKNQNGKFGF